jgi:hypothetical protein
VLPAPLIEARTPYTAMTLDAEVNLIEQMAS